MPLGHPCKSGGRELYIWASARLVVMIRQVRPCLAVAVTVFATHLGAQSPTLPTPPAATTTGHGQIVGVVIDSLNGRYLPGADILIEPARVTLQTDSLGRFQADSLSPGTYQLAVFHPLLETLGITLVTQPFHVGQDSSSLALLAVPSATTLSRRSCRSQVGPYGESAVIGHVRDPETLEAVAGAEVSIAWVDIEATRESGVHRYPHLVRDTTNSAGAFRICGLPNSLQATLQVRRGSAVTSDIPVSLGHRTVELLARTVFLPSAVSAAKSGKASIAGVVVLDGARSNAGTRVEVIGTDITATTNERGEFAMRNLPSGTRLLVARRVGFVVQTVPIDLSSREEKRVSITLPRFVEVMSPVLVTARRAASLEKVGFTQRRKTGLGFYIGPEQLENARPNYLSDILRQVPGIRVNYGVYGDVILSARGVTNGCMLYYMDDSPYLEMNRGDVNRFVTAREIVAVEVYQGSGTPAQYVRPGADCATILIWTRLKIRG